MISTITLVSREKTSSRAVTKSREFRHKGIMYAHQESRIVAAENTVSYFNHAIFAVDLAVELLNEVRGCVDVCMRALSRRLLCFAILGIANTCQSNGALIFGVRFQLPISSGRSMRGNALLASRHYALPHVSLITFLN